MNTNKTMREILDSEAKSRTKIEVRIIDPENPKHTDTFGGKKYERYNQNELRARVGDVEVLSYSHGKWLYDNGEPMRLYIEVAEGTCERVYNGANGYQLCAI